VRCLNFVVLVVTLTFARGLVGQHVSAPHASVVDVGARQAALKSTADPRLKAAMASLHTCVGTPLVPAPVGHINVPHHYLSGSHGPVNPAEAPVTRPYGLFEGRITAGMNQYLATGSGAEAACALDQMDAWAQGKALLDYDAKESTQAWFQVGWTLCAAGITDSVLVNDAGLDAEKQRRVTAWLDGAAHKLISFEKPGQPGNNLHYWRALAATAVGVTASDDKLFRFGVDTYKEAIGELDEQGALPREMERHERATHYQAFALQPLVLIAALAERQNVDLYGFKAHGRTVRDGIVFFGRAVDDPGIVKKYTADEQMKDFNGGDYAPFEFFVARFGMEGMPASIVDGLKRPTFETRIGGSATLLAAK
jgi:poly(beta-D-mannuronate) lyase